MTPFLLYLFVIAMEALSSLLVRAKEGHFLLSLRVEGIGEAGEGISHLLHMILLFFVRLLGTHVV